MVLDVNIELGSLVPDAVQCILALFGKDRVTTEARERIAERVRQGLTESATIQCIGMSHPVPIELLYQPTRFRREHYLDHWRSLTSTNVIDGDHDAIVWAPPGSGKSVFLRSTYLELLRERNKAAILFVLRTPRAVDDLEQFATDLKNKRANQTASILVLVDGYDEVSVEERKRVSAALRRLRSAGEARFVLTCRTHYDVIDLPAEHFWIEPFTPADAKEYVVAFMKAYAHSIDVDALLFELGNSGFGDFLHSPLMLTLVCILKTGPLPRLPRSTIGLIRKAIDTLTFRWDESRGVARQGEYPLDGEERVRCLMRIAFRFPKPIDSETLALQEATEYLRLLQRPDIVPQKLLLETAQWYGLFVPASDARWEFTHRTIHDFLAARHWVENGNFSRTEIPASQWNSRTAYAACLCDNATPVICKALMRCHEMSVFMECVHNHAPFDTTQVAQALFKRFAAGRFVDLVNYVRDKNSISVAISSNFMEAVSDVFLQEVLHLSTTTLGGRGHDIMYVLSRFEFSRRGMKLSADRCGRRSGLTLRLKIGPTDANVAVDD